MSQSQQTIITFPKQFIRYFILTSGMAPVNTKEVEDACSQLDISSRWGIDTDPAWLCRDCPTMKLPPTAPVASATIGANGAAFTASPTEPTSNPLKRNDCGEHRGTKSRRRNKRHKKKVHNGRQGSEREEDVEGSTEGLEDHLSVLSVEETTTVQSENPFGLLSPTELRQVTVSPSTTNTVPIEILSPVEKPTSLPLQQDESGWTTVNHAKKQGTGGQLFYPSPFMFPELWKRLGVAPPRTRTRLLDRDRLYRADDEVILRGKPHVRRYVDLQKPTASAKVDAIKKDNSWESKKPEPDAIDSIPTPEPRTVLLSRIGHMEHDEALEHVASLQEEDAEPYRSQLEGTELSCKSPMDQVITWVLRANKNEDMSQDLLATKISIFLKLRGIPVTRGLKWHAFKKVVDSTDPDSLCVREPATDFLRLRDADNVFSVQTQDILEIKGKL